MQGCGRATNHKVRMIGEILRRKINTDVKKPIVYDLFCGGGVNHTSKGLVKGTPRILFDLWNEHKGHIDILLSDTNSTHLTRLKKNLSRWVNKESDWFDVPIKENVDDLDAVGFYIGKNEARQQMRDVRFIELIYGIIPTVIVDPNGLKEMPFREIIRYRKEGRKFNIILNTNDRAFNTNTRHPIKKKGKKFGWWIDDVEDKVDFYCQLSEVFDFSWIQEYGKTRTGWRVSAFLCDKDIDLSDLGMFNTN